MDREQNRSINIISIEDLATEMHSHGLSAEDADKIEIPLQYKDWWFDQFFLSNLKFAYSKIEEKK